MRSAAKKISLKPIARLAYARGLTRKVRPTPFETWVQAEGLKIITTRTVPDVLTVELEPWKRTGCLGALLDMTHDPSQPEIRVLFEEECRKRGVTSRMTYS